MVKKIDGKLESVLEGWGEKEARRRNRRKLYGGYKLEPRISRISGRTKSSATQTHHTINRQEVQFEALDSAQSGISFEERIDLKVRERGRRFRVLAIYSNGGLKGEGSAMTLEDIVGVKKGEKW